MVVVLVELPVKVIVISFNVGRNLSERGDRHYHPTKKETFVFVAKVYIYKKIFFSILSIHLDTAIKLKPGVCTNKKVTCVIKRNFGVFLQY